LAEDNEGLQEAAKEMLGKLGYRVILASNGTEAVQLFTKNPGQFDLIILDVVMPKVSGPAAFSQMTAVRPDLRVLFSTGYTAEAASLNSLTEQGASVLQKPYSLKNLGQMVRAILDSPRNTFVPTKPSEILG
jgi:CheY-like chemotaxis protein